MDPWLGQPRWKAGEGRFTLTWRFRTAFAPVRPMGLKVEINTREHFDVLGLDRRTFVVDNPWFAGEAALPTYALEELLGTKMRALYQRRKGRDLFDLWLVLGTLAVDVDQVVRCLDAYLAHGGAKVSRAQFEANMAAKMEDVAFREDVLPLLRPGLVYDVDAAWDAVHHALLTRMMGETWKGRGAGSTR